MTETDFTARAVGRHMCPFISGESHVDRETVLDTLVNVVPMAILLFFVVLFLVLTPWGIDATFLVAHFLTIFPLVLLAILTYVSASVIARDEDYDAREGGEGRDERVERGG